MRSGWTPCADWGAKMVLDQFALAGKVAIVTGCSTGLGEGMAIGLAEAGADIAGVSSSAGPYKAQGLIRDLGRKFVQIRANLSLMASVDEVVEKTVEAFGKIDILVNNAGIIRREDAISFTEK